MTIKRASLVSAAACVLALLGWLALSPSLVPGSNLAPASGHTLLHLNCPPGSHGQPRYTGVGQSLDKARQDARTARSLESRALTAQ